MLDLECSNLKANYGRVLCGCIKDLGGKVHTFRQDAVQTGEMWDDTKTVAQILEALHNYDLLVTWFGRWFDVPFLRTRGLHLKRRKTVSVFHLDLWNVCKNNLNLNSNRLASAQAFFKLPDAKTPLDPDQWSRATAGDTRVYDAIVKHCVMDVKVLEGAYDYLLPYVKTIGTRILI